MAIIYYIYVKFYPQRPSDGRISQSKLEKILLSLQAETYLDADLESDGDGVDTVGSFIAGDRMATPAAIVSDRVFEEQLKERSIKWVKEKALH